MSAHLADRMQRIEAAPLVLVNRQWLPDAQLLELGHHVIVTDPSDVCFAMPPEPAAFGCIAGWISDDDNDEE